MKVKRKLQMIKTLIVLSSLLVSQISLADPLNLEADLFQLQCSPNLESCDENGFFCSEADRLNFDLHVKKDSLKVKDLFFAEEEVTKFEMQSETFEDALSFRFLSGMIDWKYDVHIRFSELNKRQEFRAVVNRVVYSCNMHSISLREKMNRVFNDMERLAYEEDAPTSAKQDLKSSCQLLQSMVSTEASYPFDLWSINLAETYARQYCGVESFSSLGK